MTELAGRKLRVQAAELKPGDAVAEYNGAVVASVRESTCYEGVTEILFENHTGIYFRWPGDGLHVVRPGDDEGDEDSDGAAAGWDDDEGRW